jgi:hypothetical protein
MIRDTKRIGNLGLGMVGFSCGPDPAFCYWSDGLVLLSYRRDVQKPGLGRATDFVEFPAREEGAEPQLFLDVACSINLINISLSSFAIPDHDPR